ncbi:MAG: efflux RND transporter periplasmic adaptor subunit [Candidatus Eisenbacteria bacterium]|nr:efflux RND transporter periplasmic adaptor subunit [Candidatus Eisenbacteria bacterium]
MRRSAMWIAAAVAAAALAAGCGGGTGRGAEAAGTPDGRRAKVAVGDVAVRLAEVGEIQPKTKVLVKSKVSGKITRLVAREGAWVNKGGVLAVVEPDMAQARTVATLKSGYGRARVDLDRARQDHERDVNLHSAGHISDEALKLSKDALDIATIEYRSALEQMKLAAEDGVTTEPEAESAQFLEILAPASGIVIELQIEEGEIVTSGALSYTSGSTLMAIANLSAMQIRAGVNEVDAGKIRNGQAVAIDVDAYPDVEYHGVITHIAPAARSAEGVKIFDIEIDVTDSDERLRPGMTANIEIRGDHREGVLTVPVEAVFRKQGRHVVYVFDGSGNAPVEREIRTGISTIDLVEVVSGLSEGEEVALYDPALEGQQKTEDELRRERMAAGRRG